MSAVPLLPLPPHVWDRGGREFEWEGHRLFVRSGGSGPALLMIHGFPTSSWDWARLWPLLEPRHRLYTLDMLGFGRSAKPRNFAYSVRASADQWQAFVQWKGIDEAHVIAHDYGDSVAQELLARQAEGTLPFRIASVVFLNGGLFPEAHRALTMQKLLAGPFGPLLARLSGYSRFAAAMRRICAKPLDDLELRENWRVLRLADGHLRLPALLGYLRERREQRARWVGALEKADVPLRLVVGMLDPVSGAAMARRYREVLASADVVELPEVGHYPQLEDAAAVRQALEEFHDVGQAPEGRRDPDSFRVYAGVDRRSPT
jgi:pimeloyl-ACP methyl ester carboxylesterase